MSRSGLSIFVHADLVLGRAAIHTQGCIFVRSKKVDLPCTANIWLGTRLRGWYNLLCPIPLPEITCTRTSSSRPHIVKGEQRLRTAQPKVGAASAHHGAKTFESNATLLFGKRACSLALQCLNCPVTDGTLAARSPQKRPFRGGLHASRKTLLGIDCE